MTWRALGSSWLVAARKATVLPTPTSPVMTPSSDSLIQKRMRATASWWLARSHSWLAGMVLLNGVRVKPKWLTQGARVMTVPRRRHAAGRGRQSGQATAGRARPRSDPGNRHPSTAVAELVGPEAPDGERGA